MRVPLAQRRVTMTGFSLHRGLRNWSLRSMATEREGWRVEGIENVEWGKDMKYAQAISSGDPAASVSVCSDPVLKNQTNHH